MALLHARHARFWCNLSFNNSLSSQSWMNLNKLSCVIETYLFIPINLKKLKRLISTCTPSYKQISAVGIPSRFYVLVTFITFVFKTPIQLAFLSWLGHFWIRSIVGKCSMQRGDIWKKKDLKIVPFYLSPHF